MNEGRRGVLLALLAMISSCRVWCRPAAAVTPQYGPYKIHTSPEWDKYLDKDYQAPSYPWGTLLDWRDRSRYLRDPLPCGRVYDATGTEIMDECIFKFDILTGQVWYDEVFTEDTIPADVGSGHVFRNKDRLFIEKDGEFVKGTKFYPAPLKFVPRV